MSYQPKTYRKQGGDEFVVASSGKLTMQKGSYIDGSTGRTGFVLLDLMNVREISSNEPSGTMLSTGTTPQLVRVNGATDKALCLNWSSGNSDEVQFAPIPTPIDWSTFNTATVHLLIDKGSTANQTANIDVQVFAGVGDTECGGVTGAITNSSGDGVAEYSVTLAAADLPAYPNVLNVALVPSAHAADSIRVYGAWMRYARNNPST